jgi:hypothetical protein
MNLGSARILFFFLLCTGAAFLIVEAQTTTPDVSISGSLSARAIRQDELLQFVLTIKNKADGKIPPNALLQNLTLQELPSGYSLATDADKKICVLPLLPPQTDSCQTAGDFEKNKRALASALAPGQSITVQGYLKPNSSHKAASLTAVVGWTASNGQPSSQSVSLGENQVQQKSQTAWTWLSDLVKLLAIPVVLALIGWGLNLLNRKHDERLAEANRERDEVAAKEQAKRQDDQHKHEQEQAVRSETWKQMLLVSHNYAAKCYLPLSLAATRLAINLRALSTPHGDARIAFYYVLLCGREMSHTRKRTGGLYFKDLRGETLAGECWRLQRDALISGNEEDPFNLAIRYAIESVTGVDTYATFKRKFEVAGAAATSFNNPDIQNAWTLFNAWRAAEPRAVNLVAQYMEGFFAILDYEANRPYQYWYDTEPRLVVSEETEKNLRGILAAQNYKTEEINQYFANIARP